MKTTKQNINYRYFIEFKSPNLKYKSYLRVFKVSKEDFNVYLDKYIFNVIKCYYFKGDGLKEYKTIASIGYYADCSLTIEQQQELYNAVSEKFYSYDKNYIELLKENAYRLK